MNNYIEDFTYHLRDALKIGNKTNFAAAKNSISNILICGLGGSGIGGTIVNDLLSKKISVPISATKGYAIPAFVGESTLVVACSYSGNTEETLMALEKCFEKKAEVAIITSGGKLEKIAKEFPEIIEEIRGRGFILGIKCKVQNLDFVNCARENYLLTIKASDNVVRLLPPINLTMEDEKKAIEMIKRTCEQLS